MSLRNDFLLPCSEIQVDSLPAKDYLVPGSDAYVSAFALTSFVAAGAHLLSDLAGNCRPTNPYLPIPCELSLAFASFLGGTG